MRLVVAILLVLLAGAAVAGALDGLALIPCVIVAVVAAAAAVAVFAEHFFWRVAAYAAAIVALAAAIFLGGRIAIGATIYALAIAALTWAAPLRPRRSRMDHLASSSARSA